MRAVMGLSDADVQDHTLAEERRQNELRRKLDKLHRSRELFEVLQAKNHESYVVFSRYRSVICKSSSYRQVADVEKRRAELLRAIKRKDRRTDHFVKDKEETVKLVGSLIPLRTSSPTLVASSLARWPNLRKTLERTDEETTKTSIRRPNEQN